MEYLAEAVIESFMESATEMTKTGIITFVLIILLIISLFFNFHFFSKMNELKQELVKRKIMIHDPENGELVWTENLSFQ